MEKFTEFDLRLAIEKPHLVRSKSYPNLVCQKVSVGNGDEILVDWAGRHNQVKVDENGN